MPTHISQWHVELDAFVCTSLFNLLCEIEEEFVKLCSSSAFFLLLLKFILITMAMFSLSVARFVESCIRCIPAELNIFCLLLADHDRIDEMEMNYHHQFMFARLEEEMLDVVKQNVDFHGSLSAGPMRIPDTVLMDLDISSNSFCIQSRAKHNHIKDLGSTLN